ncbi:MAG: ergothioneine biosynthesis protein EgtB [Polaromonas sp.]
MPTDLISTYKAVRQRSAALAAPLTPEDSCVQSMPDTSPAKWHLAHTTWFFETFVLEPREVGFKPFNSAFRMLFNSYYNAVGNKHPRPQRGLLTRPGLSEVLSYRKNVDERIQALLLSGPDDPELHEILVLGLHHEQQHQELLLTDIKHLFSLSPLHPAYTAPAPFCAPGAPLEWHDFPGGVVQIGHEGDQFCFDNEKPRHRVYLQAYQLASRLVTNGEYLAFIEAQGYNNPSHWLAEGWDWRLAQGRDHPLYWQRSKTGWQEFTLGGLRALDPHAPVLHVSYFEAEAYARWAGARLPTEAEWESAAAPLALKSHFTGAGGFHPGSAQSSGLSQLSGDAWQWTQSSYAPYPGFHAPAGAVGEYNGKFMVNQYVLRGGSCVTQENHLRVSYRNFFPASACWQFSGIRLARDVRHGLA